MNSFSIKLSACSVVMLLTACASSSPPVTAPPVQSFATPTPTLTPAPATSAKSPTIKVFENRLRTDVAQKSKINVQKVNCPTQIQVEVKQPFICEATAEGKTFTVVINPRGDRRELQWSTKGLLVLPKLEQTIQQGIRTQFRLAVKTNCGGKVRVAKPGDRFQCQITDDRGQTRAVTVQVDDDQGNVTWKL